MNEKLLVLVIAFLIDVIIGDPPNIIHPVAGIGFFIKTGESWIRTEKPKLLFLSGMGIVLFCSVLFYIIPVSILFLINEYPMISIIIQAVLLKLTFSLRRLIQVGLSVEQTLKDGDISHARELVSRHLVSRSTTRLDEGHINSALIESWAENLSDSYVAPFFFYLIGGLPFAWIYRTINTTDAMMGYRSGRYEYLGKFAARLDDVMNFIPSRLSALLIIISSCVLSIFDTSSYHGKQSWQVMRLQHGETSSPNAGYPMSAISGALYITLEKNGEYCLKGGDALPGIRHIIKARNIIIFSALLWLCLCMILVVII